MTRTSQRDKARLFHDLHDGRAVLCLLNAWDAGVARIFEAEGCPAIGTTSAGVAYAQGKADGEMGRDEMVEAVGRIAAAVEIPVSADIEAGFGATPEEVGEVVAAVIEAGAIGINLEDRADGDAPALRDIDDHCARIGAARESAEAAGIDLFINGRTDVFWLELEGEDRLDAAIERVQAYAAAGSDGVFIPRLVDPEEIRRVAESVAVPLNVLVAPGTPPVAELAKLGVKRLSTGSAPARASLALARRIAGDLLGPGGYGAMLDPTILYADANRLMHG
ncbi:MAG TPA: isocitrate lyase/phosphoenolpyruvate mutase family protein [Solirubrobacterales bacterium]